MRGQLENPVAHFNEASGGLPLGRKSLPYHIISLDNSLLGENLGAVEVCAKLLLNSGWVRSALQKRYRTACTSWSSMPRKRFLSVHR